MTEDEFLTQYHEYRADSHAEASAEAARVNEQLEVGTQGPVVAIDFGSLGYGLMLRGPAESLGLWP